jgi:hypothetical protein
VSKKLAVAVLALSLVTPALALAQDAKPEPATPGVAAVGSKTLGFEKIAAWTERARGSLVGHFEAAGVEDAGTAQILVQRSAVKPDFDKELGVWMARWKGDDGRRLDTSAAKVDSFDVNGIAVKTAEFSGSSPAGKEKGKKERGEPVPGQKTIAALLDAPDGAAVVVKMVGPAKTVDANRESFMKYVKSAHLVDKPADDGKGKKGKKAKDD